MIFSHAPFIIQRIVWWICRRINEDAYNKYINNG